MLRKAPIAITNTAIIIDEDEDNLRWGKHEIL
jgi:hypothetical protein